MHPVREVDAAAMTGAKQSPRIQYHTSNIHPSFYTRPTDNRPKNQSFPTTFGKRSAENAPTTGDDLIEFDDYRARKGRATKFRRRQNHTDNIHSAARTQPASNCAKNSLVPTNPGKGSRRSRNCKTRLIKSDRMEIDHTNTAREACVGKPPHFRNQPRRVQNRVENIHFVNDPMEIDDINMALASRARKPRRFRSRHLRVHNRSDSIPSVDGAFPIDYEPMEIDDINTTPATNCARDSQNFQHQPWGVGSHIDNGFSVEDTYLVDCDPMELDNIGPVFEVVGPVYIMV